MIFERIDVSTKKKVIVSVAIILLVVSWLLSVYPPSTGLTGTTKILVDLLTKYGRDISSFVILGFLGWFFYEAIKQYVWEDKVKKFIDEEGQKLSSALESIRTDTRELLDEHTAQTKEFYKERRLETAIAQSDPRELISNMRMIHSSAYGDHCESEKGLYYSVENLVAKYFKADVPHRSNHNQDITIECEGDRVKWVEDTSYELHTIAVDEDYKTPHDTQTVSHPLTYNTSAGYVDLEDLRIVIYADTQKEPVFTTDDQLEFEKDDDGNVVSITHRDPSVATFDFDEKSGEWLIKVRKVIEICSSKVMVKIHEESFISEDFFVVCRDVPTCASTLSITLPKTWEFTNITIPPNQGWDIVETLPYKRKAFTTGWVLPGIALSCTWKKGSAPDKSLASTEDGSSLLSMAANR